MAWLQAVTEWFSGPQQREDWFDDPNALPFPNRNEDLNERQRAHVGEGTRSRDKEELAKLRNKWDNDKWQRAGGGFEDASPTTYQPRVAGSNLRPVPPVVPAPKQPEPTDVTALRAHLNNLAVEGPRGTQTAQGNFKPVVPQAIASGPPAHLQNLVTHGQSTGAEAPAVDDATALANELCAQHVAEQSGVGGQEAKQWTEEAMLDLARRFKIRRPELEDAEVWAHVRAHILMESSDDPFSTLPPPGAGGHVAEEAAAKSVSLHPPPVFAGNQQMVLRSAPADQGAMVVSERAGGEASGQLVNMEPTGVGSLVEILYTVSGDARAAPARSLRILAAQSRENQDEIMRHRALPPLIDLVSTGSPASQAIAAGCMQKVVAWVKDHQLAVVQLRGVPPLAKLAWNQSSPEATLAACRCLRNVSNAGGALEGLLTGGAVPPLLKLVASAAVKAKSQSLGAAELGACEAAADTFRNMLAAESTLGLKYLESSWWAGGRPSKVLVEGGAVPALVGMLRAGRSPQTWLSALGALSNLCAVCPPARQLAAKQHCLPFLVEAYLSDIDGVRQAACAALWTVNGLAPEMAVTNNPKQIFDQPGTGVQVDRTDAPPLCFSDGVRAYHNQVWIEGEYMWWEPPLIPLVRLMREGLDDVAREAAASALARAMAAVTIPAHQVVHPRSEGGGFTTAVHNAARIRDGDLHTSTALATAARSSLHAGAGPLVVSEAGSGAQAWAARERARAAAAERLKLAGPSLDDLRKKRQTEDYAQLEVEGEVSAVPEVQAQFLHMTGVQALVPILELGTTSALQPAAARCLEAAFLANTPAALIALETGAAQGLVKMLASSSPYGKAAAAAALCTMSADPAVCGAVVRAGAVPNLVLLVACGDGAGRLQAARALLRLAVEDPAAVAATGAVPALVQELQLGLGAGVPQGEAAHGPMMLRKELAVCTLLMVCRAAPEHQLFVARSGCASALVKLLQDAPARQRRSVAALIDVVAQHPDARDALAKAAIPALTQLAGDNGAAMDARASAVGALWRLSQDHPARALQVTRCEGYRAMCGLLVRGEGHAKRCAILLLGEMACCLDLVALQEVTPHVLNTLADPSVESAGEACLTVQRMVSRGIKASDPRVVIHREGRCAATAGCDVCAVQRMLAGALPTLLRLVSGAEYRAHHDTAGASMVPHAAARAALEETKAAAAGALATLVERNSTNAVKAAHGGAVLELVEVARRGGVTGARVEAAHALAALAEAEPPLRGRIAQAGGLLPALELCEAGLHSLAGFMSTGQVLVEQNRVALWQSEGEEVLMEAFGAGAGLLESVTKEEDACLGLAVLRPHALRPLVRLAGLLFQPDSLVQNGIVASPVVDRMGDRRDPRAQAYQRSACRTLEHLARHRKLHHVLLDAGAASVLCEVLQQENPEKAPARTREAALDALAGLAARGDRLRAETGVLPAPDEVQSALLKAGALSIASRVVVHEEAEDLKAAAARLGMLLSEVVQGLGTLYEREVLAMKPPLIHLRDTARLQAHRDVAEEALGYLFPFEAKVAKAWTSNMHQQTVAEGKVYSYGAPDMDRLD